VHRLISLLVICAASVDRSGLIRCKAKGRLGGKQDISAVSDARQPSRAAPQIGNHFSSKAGEKLERTSSIAKYVQVPRML